MKNKGRCNHKAAKGEKKNTAKLTNKEVLKIRKLYLNGFNLSYLAKKFNVSVTNVRCIVNRKTWKHI